jgi:hypothetical protein
MITELALAKVGLVQFDCILSETHSGDATVSDHPVEEGSDITDHIRALPEELELNGLVSDTPISLKYPEKSPVSTDLAPTLKRVDAAYAALQDAKNKGEPVDVITSLRKYSNMAITAFSVTKDAANGNVLNCTLSLRQIIIAKTQTVKLPVPKKVVKKAPVDKGTTQPEPQTPPEPKVVGGFNELPRLG